MAGDSVSYLCTRAGAEGALSAITVLNPGPHKPFGAEADRLRRAHARSRSRSCPPLAVLC